MLRSSMKGALAFGLTAAVAGYVWTAFEFPFAILVPGVVGWLLMAWPDYGARKAWLAALVGGLTFTIAFMVGMFFAITDGSPVALPMWLMAPGAAAVAGALTGAVLAGRKGAGVLAVFSAAGMLAGIAIASMLRFVQPAAIDTPGLAQAAYFAVAIGLVGAAVGAAIGLGIERLHLSDPRAMTSGFSREAKPAV